MKKTFLFASIVLAAAVLFSACQKETETTEENEVTNNLPASKGNNEVKNSSWITTDADVSVEFKEDTATIVVKDTPAATSNNVLPRKTEVTGGGTNYKYSYNETDKTLYFQLDSVFTASGATSTYEQELDESQKKYSDLKSALIDILDADSAEDAFSTALGEATASTTLLIKALGSYFTEKVTKFFEDQQSALSTYLASKYNSVIDLNYTLTENSLTLTQKFKEDINDASSEFRSEGDTIILNDYEDIIPFSVTAGGKTYIGLPKIEGKKEGTITVDLYSELKDFADGTTTAAELVQAKSKEVQDSITSLLSTQSIRSDLRDLLLSSSVNEYLDNKISEVSGNTETHTLVANFTTQTSGNSTILTLIPTTVPTETNLASVFKKSTAITLTYKPVLEYILKAND